MNDITEYEREVMDRTGWDLKEVRRVLEAIKNDTLCPSDRQYYLEKISPF